MKKNLKLKKNNKKESQKIYMGIINHYRNSQKDRNNKYQIMRIKFQN